MPDLAAAEPPARPLTVSATVRNVDGSPAASLPLTIGMARSTCHDVEAEERDEERTVTTVTSSSGVFATTVDGPGVVRVRIGGDAPRIGYIPATRSSDAGDLETRPVSHLPTSPPPTSARQAVLTVRDVNSDKPIPGALVWQEDSPSCWSRTGPDGTAAIHGDNVRWAVAAPGFTDAQIAGGSARLSVALRPTPVSLRGEVRGVAGVALAQVLVEIDSPRRAVRTGADGSFELSDLPASFPFEVRASTPGLGSTARRVVSATNPIRLDLFPPREVAGAVRDPDGKLVAAGQVALLSAGHSIDSITNSDGEFVFRDVSVGRYDLRVDAVGFTTALQPVEVPAGHGRLRLPVITLKAAAAELRGRVEDRQGDPVADVAVFVRRGGIRLGPGGVPAGRPDSLTEPDGTFHLTNLEGTAGTKLLLWRRGYRPLEAALKADAVEQTFTLEPASSLTLRVRRSNGSPATGATVRGIKPLFSGSADFPRTNDEGELVFDGLSAASHTVAIDGGDGTYWEGEVRVPPPPSETAMDIVLRRPHLLAGTVIDDDGAPVTGAKVEVPGSAEAIDITDASGQFDLGGVLDFPVDLAITHPRYVPKRVEVGLSEAESGNVRIPLEDRSTLVRGRVEGEEVGGLRLRWVHETSHRALTVTTQVDGGFELGYVNPGRYHLSLDGNRLVIAPERSVVVVDATAPEQFVVVPLIRPRR